MDAPNTHAAPHTAVCGAARAMLCAAPLDQAYGAAVTAALALPGNILSDAPDLRWARPVWTCCVAAAGDWTRAVPVATALELFMVALDVLDDVEDAEDGPLQAEWGQARTLNVSTGLLFLAQRSLLTAEHGAAAGAILLGAGLCACGGQHADLAPPAERRGGLDDSLAVAAGKSAPLVAVACQLGALCAGADSPTQELYARFGGYAGMVAQLLNDLTAIRPEATGKTDIALGRPTLPLAYAALLAPDAPVRDVDMRTGLWARGPIQLTWAVAETYRRRALDMISRLTDDPTSRAALAALVRLQ